jgi:hypothetical protein
VILAFRHPFVLVLHLLEFDLLFTDLRLAASPTRHYSIRFFIPGRTIRPLEVTVDV